MSTVIVFELPVDFFRSCLVPFLDLRSVARLDTSTLNFNLRTSLRHKLSGCTLSDAHYAFYKTTPVMLQWMSRRRVGLKKMWLHNSVTDPDVLHLHPMLTKALVDVSFCQCNRLSAHAIISFLSSCGNLEKLNLVSTSAHCGLVVIEIAKHCPLLSDINMVNGIASDTDIFLLAQRFRALRVLKLRKCDWITDAAVEALARYLPGLQELSLHCKDRITDTAIIMLMQHCTAMTVLELDHCNLLTDAAVLAIAGSGASLTYLDLYGCTAVTDVGVTAIAHSCPKLTGLCLAGRKQLSDASMVSVVQSCSGLTSLNLCFCHGLTDASLHAIAAHCPALVSLLLMEVYNITPEGVWAVRKGCSELFDLRIDNYLYHGTTMPYAPHPVPGWNPDSPHSPPLPRLLPALPPYSGYPIPALPLGMMGSPFTAFGAPYAPPRPGPVSAPLPLTTLSAPMQAEDPFSALPPSWDAPLTPW